MPQPFHPQTNVAMFQPMACHQCVPNNQDKHLGRFLKTGVAILLFSRMSPSQIPRRTCWKLETRVSASATSSSACMRERMRNSRVADSVMAPTLAAQLFGERSMTHSTHTHTRTTWCGQKVQAGSMPCYQIYQKPTWSESRSAASPWPTA